MALPINIEDLLNKRKVESNRIEFKASWNPDKVYNTICAFTTDLENVGGEYILIGVEEEYAAGIPTIQKHLRLNGNAPATIDTDDARTYFLMTIPYREDMIGKMI